LPIGDEGRYWRMFYIDRTVVSGIAGEFGETMHSQFEFCDPVLQKSRLVAALSRLFSCAALEEGDGEGFARECLVSILGEVAGTSVSKPAGLRHRIGPALRMIDEAPAQAATLGDLSRLCGLSSFQLLRGFVAVTGLTPHAYLLQRRVDLARRLIRGAVPLAEAALEAGFTDQSHMTRAFSARYGYSPGAYAVAFR
jgi:AraC-like DNA-binding protein